MIPVGAAIDNVGHSAECFDVVDGGGFVFEAVGNGEGRLVARERMFPFEGVEEGSFLTTDVGSGAATDVEVEGKAAVLNIVSEESGFQDFGKAALEEGVGFGVFIAEVDEAARCSGGKASDDHAFDEGIRIVVHEGAVFETTGFTFIGVADDGFRVTVALGDGVPFDSSGEARSASSGQSGGGDCLDDALGSGATESFGEGGKAAVGLVSFEGVVSFLTDVGKEALFVYAGIGSGKRGGSGFEIVGGGASEGGVSGEDGDGFVTAAGAGHFGGSLSLCF